MAGENWTFWFNMTNFALGLITLLAVLVVFVAVGWDLAVLWLHKVRKTDQVEISNIDMNKINADLVAMWRGDSHSLPVHGLGLTMADGGEKIEPSDSESSEPKTRRK